MGIDIKRKMVKANLRLGQGSQVRSIQEEYWTSNSWRVDEFDVGLNNSKIRFNTVNLFRHRWIYGPKAFCRSGGMRDTV